MALKVIEEHIVITPNVMGGKPRIAGHRISVQDVAIWHNELGYTAEQIANDYKLNLADVYAALTYYYDHKEEIDDAIAKGKKRFEEMKRKNPSKIKNKRHGN
jgi:uncharacterized protein (DUF433 family)